MSMLQVTKAATLIEECLFADSLNKSGYYGRARSLVSHINGSSSVVNLVSYSHANIRELLHNFAHPINTEESIDRAQASPPCGKSSACMVSSTSMHCTSGALSAGCNTSLRGIEETCTILERLLPARSGGSDGQEAVLSEACALLRALELSPVTMELLKQSTIGKRVKAYTKHSDSSIAALAKSVIRAWKVAVLREAA